LKTGEECVVSGQCVGNYLTKEVANDAEECLNKCQDYEGLDANGDGEPDLFCTWFLYNSLTEDCQFLSSCERIVDSCPTCQSGSIYCGGEPSSSGNEKI